MLFCPTYLAIFAFGTGKERVFIEKPVAETPEQLYTALREKPTGTLAQVDYIECANPVVLATKEIIKDATPIGFYNHRAKDLRGMISRGKGGGEGSQIILEDLVHDFSEISFLGGDLSTAEIKDVNTKTWKEMGYPYETDIEADIKLKLLQSEAYII
jgi:predicted dehydrogenase